MMAITKLSENLETESEFSTIYSDNAHMCHSHSHGVTSSQDAAPEMMQDSQELINIAICE